MVSNAPIAEPTVKSKLEIDLVMDTAPTKLIFDWAAPVFVIDVSTYREESGGWGGSLDGRFSLLNL